MQDNLTPYEDRECPVYNKTINGELCYETALCMSGHFNPSSVQELEEIKDVEKMRKICLACPHSNFD